MELIRHIIKNEAVYIPKFDVNVNHKYVLLGFKDSLPVLSSMNTMDSKPNILKNVKIETSNKGDKFIMVNGKKIKILAESELPKNSQIVKIGSLQNASPVQFKILKSIPSNQSGKPNPPSFTPIKLDKKIITSQIGKVPLIENKLIKIPISVVEPIRANTTDSGTSVDNMKLVKMQSIGGKHRQLVSNSQLFISHLMGDSKSQSVCGALDLTKNCESSSKVFKTTMMVSKGVQVDFPMVNREVQTDFQKPSTEDDLESILKNLDFSWFDDVSRSPAAAKKIMDINLDSEISGLSDIINDSTNEYTTLSCAPSKRIQNLEQNTKEESFFKELRAALQPDDKGNLPIHIGVLTNDIEMVKRSCFILKIVLKKSIDIPNSNDMTALQLAVLSNSSIDIITYLLQKGAKMNVTDSDGNNILHYAVENERTEALKLLLNYAVQQRLNLDQHNNGGLTPLMICCLNSYHDCAEILLEAEADPNVKDQISGRTALFHAAELHDVDMVEMLLQFNACTKIKNFFGTSPHDAMYEIEEMPDAIKFMILGKNNKRKAAEIMDCRPTKFQKKIDKNRKVLKTYARLEKIRASDKFKLGLDKYLMNGKSYAVRRDRDNEIIHSTRQRV